MNKKFINTIIKQTYKNIEIIVVDDGSTDEAFSVCNRLSKRLNQQFGDF